MGNRIDIKKGERYGRFTIIREVGKRNSRRMFLCKCDCEIKKEIHLGSLRTGDTKSCGCLQKEKVKESRTTHGMKHTREYKTWECMKQRCLNKKNKDYKNYGGRGIKVCERWLLRFENFYKDMRGRPRGFNLDRIDNNKGYCKENCRWATQKEQCNNTRRNRFITYKNETLTITQWSEKLGINYKTLWGRLKRGWKMERVFTEIDNEIKK